MTEEKQAVDIDGLLDELLAPRYSQVAPETVKNEDIEVYHNGSSVGVPFVMPLDDDDDYDYDDDDYDDDDDDI